MAASAESPAAPLGRRPAEGAAPRRSRSGRHERETRRIWSGWNGGHLGNGFCAGSAGP